MALNDMLAAPSGGLLYAVWAMSYALRLEK